MDEPIRFGDLADARQRLSPAELVFERRRRTAGLFLGPPAFLAVLFFPPTGLSPEAGRLAAIMAWVLIWWVTEAVPIPITALMGPALAVVFGVFSAKEALAGFGDPVIFLFLGSFVLAEAMAFHGLDRRVAFALLGTRLFGGSGLRCMVGFACLAAGLSMWLSNTATTAMLYPIALGTVAALRRPAEGEAPGAVEAARRRLAGPLLFACAYGASIGGIGTPVGTPPNLIALGQLATLVDIHISFVRWMALAVPISAAMLAFALVYLGLLLPAEMRGLRGGREVVAAERRRLGPWTLGQKNVVVAFGLAVSLWVLPGIVGIVAGNESPSYRWLSRAFPESIVALLAVCLLFVLPVDWKERRFTFSWTQAAHIDWGTLLLFGGGLALGGAMFKTGLAAAVGQTLTELTGASSAASLTVVFTVFAVFLTELTSNTATATMLVPLAIASAQAAGVDVLPPALGCALGCSMAFMLPVATPPNAIIYGSGQVRITQMVRLGFWVNLAASVIVPAAVLALAHLVRL